MRRKTKIRFPRKYCTLPYFECIGYNPKGQGIVVHRDKPFFVNGLLVGEQARIQIFAEFETYGEARAVSVLAPSKERVLELDHPKLELGVYQLAHLSPNAQDAFKQARVESLFGSKTKKIVVGRRTFYRNKVVLTDGGFRPPGWKRRHIIQPTEGQFDLMYLDFEKYKHTRGDLIIRRLNAEMVGRPGEERYVFDDFGDKVFRVGLNSFYQVNGEMARIAYQQIKSFIPDDSIVFDLFAGSATIGIFVSDVSKKVYSVEINYESYLDALENVKLNGVKNLMLVQEDANKWCMENAAQKGVDVIIIDPSRAGLTPEAVMSVNNSTAKRVIYLSCNIDTQYRDVRGLTNYEIVLVQPYDFFPQTYHIENLVVLDRL